MRAPTACFLLIGSLAGTIAGGQTCNRAVTFAVASGGGMAFRLPNVSNKWFEKAQKAHPDVCFTQRGASGSRQFLVVLSNSRDAFDGVVPVYNRRTDTTTAPVWGNGTVNDSSGSNWSYIYSGTVTTTTTTTKQTNLPYRDTTNTLFARAYDEQSVPIGISSRSTTTRQGGDGMGTLGYNLGATLRSIGIKERLLTDVIAQVASARIPPAGAAPAIYSTPPAPHAQAVHETVPGSPSGSWFLQSWDDSFITVKHDGNTYRAKCESSRSFNNAPSVLDKENVVEFHTCDLAIEFVGQEIQPLDGTQRNSAGYIVTMWNVGSTLALRSWRDERTPWRHEAFTILSVTKTQ